MKKSIKIISHVSTTILIISLMVMIMSILTKMNNKVPSFMGYSILYVSTGSMEPTYPVGSCLLAKKTDAAKLAVDDIICFYSKDEQIDGLPNTHRIVSISQKDGKYTFRTKGDANESEDRVAVGEDQLIGKIQTRVKILEKIRSFMMSIAFYVIFILLPLAAIMVGEIISIIKGYKESEEPEEKTNEEASESEESKARLELDDEQIDIAIAEKGLDVSDQMLRELVKKYGASVLEDISKSKQNAEDESENNKSC